jgi:hypothetical protein
MDLYTDIVFMDKITQLKVLKFPKNNIT